MVAVVAKAVPTQPRDLRETEIGLLPSDWEVIDLGDAYEFQNGVNADARAYGKGIPFANVLEVITNSQLTAAAIPGRVSLTADKVRSFSVRRGDILFNRTSETQEEVGLSSVYMDDVPVVFGGFVIRGRQKDESFDAGYVGYALRAPFVRRQIVAKGQGAVRANIGQDALRTIRAPRPARKEQEAIASALSDADALIESLEMLIAKKRAIKQGAAQDLLTGRKRLPGFTDAWESRKLAQIGEVLIGLTYTPANVSKSGTLVLRASNIQNGALEFGDNVFVQMDIPDRTKVKAGDILVCVRNGSRDLIGKCAKIDERCEGMAFGAFMAVFRTPFHDYVHHQFQSEPMKRQIREHLGATINQITNKSLNSFTVPFPPDEKERAAIAAVLSEMDDDIAAHEGKLTKVRRIKQGMMQDLLTGRVRLV